MVEKYWKFHESLFVVTVLIEPVTDSNMIHQTHCIPSNINHFNKPFAILPTAVSLTFLFISNIPVQFIFFAYCLVSQIQSQIQFPSVCCSNFSYHTQFVWSLKTVASLKGILRNSSCFFLYQRFVRYIVTSNPTDLLRFNLLDNRMIEKR
jgi:hypothetical protein